MFAKRIIPCLDIKDGRVVKGVNFVGLRDAGDPVEAAAAYSEAGADELVFLDITASHEKRATVVELAARVAEKLSIPFTVGGGIRTAEDFREVLRQGADKISVNSAAIDGRSSFRRRPPGSAASAWWSPSTPAAEGTDRAGMCTKRAAGKTRVWTRWNGPRRRSAWARGKSCSPAWTPTAPKRGTTSS